MIDIKYSLVVEATEDPTFFTFYSPDLEGFTGVGHSVEDCLYQAKWGIEEFAAILKERGIPVPRTKSNPTIMIKNTKNMEPTLKMAATFEVYQDKSGKFRWRLRHQNGNVIADSGESYESKASAMNGIKSVKNNAPFVKNVAPVKI